MTTKQDLANKLQLHLNLENDFSLFGLSHTPSVLLIFLTILLSIALLSALGFYISRFFLLHFIRRVVDKKSAPKWLKLSYKHHLFHKISHFIPALIIYICAPLLSMASLPFTAHIANFVKMAANVYMILVGASVIYSGLDAFADQYRNFTFAKKRPIKSYLQVAKIFLLVITGLLIISALLGRSPIYFLTGLGAIAAALMFVFRDSILGFVASIQLAAYDMIHIGDWIEVPKYGADGDVIDISLNTVKVQNFDKTIVMVPSHDLLSSGVKNWRGMSESGGRRIKRAIFVDATTIQFCTPNLIEKLKKVEIFKPALEEKLEKYPIESLTNLGQFRRYLEVYFKQHPNIRQDMTSIVRQLADQGEGIPVEIYIFTTTTNWSEYEDIQADIFDHIYAMLPTFNLQPFQHLSGRQVDVTLQSLAQK